MEKTILVIFTIYLTLGIISAVPLGGIESNMVNNIISIHAGPESHHVNYHRNKTRQEILEKMSKSVNITCPEINNITFTNDPPYDILGIPQCQVSHKAVLYLNKNQTICELSLNHMPNENTTNCFKLMKNNSPSINKVVILIHGFLNGFETGWLHTMKDSIQTVEPNTAAIIVGWGRGMVGLLSYHQSASNTRYVSVVLYQAMKSLHATMDSVIPFVGNTLYTHCIGHSLGAHVCGLAGKLLNQDSVPGWDRISGMDPAGPLFFNDVPYPWNGFNCTSASRLNKTDARIVDVIHTDGEARYLGYIPQYGTLTQIGTVDFYPGTGKGAYGCYQPGCYDVFDIVACSHSRSHDYYMASIIEAVCLASRFCGDSDAHNFPDTCQDMLHNRTRTVNMGYWWPNADKTPGKYTVEITSVKPYCQGEILTNEMATNRNTYITED